MSDPFYLTAIKMNKIEMFENILYVERETNGFNEEKRNNNSK